MDGMRASMDGWDACMRTFVHGWMARLQQHQQYYIRNTSTSSTSTIALGIQIISVGVMKPTILPSIAPSYEHMKEERTKGYMSVLSSST
jgi:O-succinylbenzoate synthase